MLVLTRKLGEAIAIGDDVKIIVMQVKGKQVRLGIKAGPTTAVHREEIYQRILSENRLGSRLEQEALEQFQAALSVESSQGFNAFAKKPILKTKTRIAK